jgi:hypothetical protein
MDICKAAYTEGEKGAQKSEMKMIFSGYIYSTSIAS